jgi:hypothetical protein
LILDFRNKGPSSDHLEFSGFGQGTLTQIDTTHWAIGYENNSHAPEVIEILGASVSTTTISSFEGGLQSAATRLKT